MRYLVGLMPIFSKMNFPLHTLIINVVGAVAIGMIVKASDSWEAISGNTLLLLKTGLCGGFTTFSTFALESEEMIEAGRILPSGAYIVLSVLLCIAGVYLGKHLAAIAGI